MPKYALKDLKRAVAARNVEVAMGSALRKYQEVMGYRIIEDMQRIQIEIFEGLTKLEECNFSETVEIEDEETGEMVPYDVYALLNYRGWDWYVKF